MTGPRRIQYIRGRALPANARYIGRGSRFGNPFRVANKNSLIERTRAVEDYRLWIPTQPGLITAIRQQLAGRDVACWCRLDGLPCHGDVLLELANPPGTIHIPQPSENGCARHRTPPGRRCMLCHDQTALWDVSLRSDTTPA